MNMVFLGPPGAGKGTQTVDLAVEFNIPHISTGDMFREEIKAGTELGKLAHSYIDDGNLVPDQVTVDIIRVRLKKKDAENGFILDGFPRTIPQAEMLEKLLKDMDSVLDCAVYLDTSEETVLSRLTGRRICRECGKIYHTVNMPPKVEGVCDACGGELFQRPDDQPDSIRRRLQVYEEKTADLTKWYEDRGLLIRVNANLPREETYKEIQQLFK